MFLKKATPEVELNLLFRNYLHAHSEVRAQYVDLKAVLLRNENSQLRTGMYWVV
jgi:GrpB-like predicted nucleotidyltransferase (UPF0157 family)